MALLYVVSPTQLPFSRSECETCLLSVWYFRKCLPVYVALCSCKCYKENTENSVKQTSCMCFACVFVAHQKPIFLNLHPTSYLLHWIPCLRTLPESLMSLMSFEVLLGTDECERIRGTLLINVLKNLLRTSNLPVPSHPALPPHVAHLSTRQFVAMNHQV